MKIPRAIAKRAERRQKLGRIDRLIARFERRHREARARRARGRRLAQRRAIEKLTRMIRRAVRRRRRRRRRQKGEIGQIRIDPSNYAGAGSALDFIERFMQARGLPLGSGKRTPAYNAQIGGASNSDHLTTNTTTDARDFPTYSGADDAIALAQALGQRSWRPGTYNTFLISVGSYRFSVQILWAVSGHYDHVHVGVSRA